MTPMQTTLKSIISLADPELATLKFALAIIDLALTTEIKNIEFKDDYRKSLVCIREIIQLEIDNYYEVTPNGI